MTWIGYALLSAIFAALTALTAKVGISDINSNLATGIRTIVVLTFAWGIIFFQGLHKQISTISKYSLFFLIISGLMTGLSWLFYFRALQLGQVARVASIDKLSMVFTLILAVVLLHEKLTLLGIIGIVLMSVGAIFVGLNR